MDAAAAAAAATVVHEGYLTCIVVSSLVGRPFIKANRRCVCSSSSIRIQLPYLPPLLPLPLLLPLPFSHRFWGVVFLFFFSAIPAVVLFSPSPLKMIITQSSSSHTNYPSIFGFSFYFSFYFSFLFFFSFFFAMWWYQTMCSIKIFLEKQASRQQFEITAYSLGFLLGWFVSLSF